MPRRKKSSLATKPSLVFTESPIHVQNNVPSPVFCARCPPTAESVRVDELHNLSWVSPQFRNVRLSGGQGKRKLTRQRRHSVAGHRNIGKAYSDNHSLDKENSVIGSRNKLRKFNSLKFIGDKTNVPSIMEDVEVSIDEETESDEKENEAGNLNGIDESDSPCEGCSERGKSRNKLRTHRRNAEGTHLERIDSGANNLDKSATCLETKNELLEVFESGGLEFHDGSYNKIADLDSTRSRRHSLKDKAPIKRLFASQLVDKDVNEDKGSSGERIDNERLESKKNNLNDESFTVPESESDSANSPLIRRSERIRQLGKMLVNCESPCNLRKLTCSNLLLAPNTPENEYGWSKRKRQLISYIKKKS